MCLLVRVFRVVRGYGLIWIAVCARISVVLPSEFIPIPDFRAIVKFSAYGVSKMEIPMEFYEVRGEHFVDGS